MLVVNLYHPQKSHSLVVHIYGMKIWSGDARTLRAHGKLGLEQFLRPDIQKIFGSKQKFNQFFFMASYTIFPVKLHVYLAITLVVILITDGRKDKYTDTHTHKLQRLQYHARNRVG